MRHAGSGSPGRGRLRSSQSDWGGADADGTGGIVAAGLMGPPGPGSEGSGGVGAGAAGDSDFGAVFALSRLSSVV